MIEKVCTIGRGRNLAGIVTRPDNHPSKQLPAFILLNAGLIHRVGPFRLNVELARNIASALGALVMRFDLSGIGDSALSPDDMVDEERAVTDIKAAMNYLNHEFGSLKFVIIGLCTGADNAHKAAVRDERVVGAVFLDGYRYRTWRYYLRRYGPFFVSPGRMLRYCWRLTASALNLAKLFSKEPPAGQDFIFGWKLPPREKVEADLLSLIQRKVALLYIYSGGVLEYFNSDDFASSFPKLNFQGSLTVKRFSKANHTYSFMADRQKLINSICDWSSCQLGVDGVMRK